MKFDDLPIIVVAAFLTVAGFYHLFLPTHSEQLLSKNGPIRIVGGVLSLLGLWCLFIPKRVSYLVGLSILISGLVRFLAPGWAIKINSWTSRYMHGVLMLLGALACVLLLIA
jgi:hypothetical protein